MGAKGIHLPATLSRVLIHRTYCLCGQTRTTQRQSPLHIQITEKGNKSHRHGDIPAFLIGQEVTPELLQDNHLLGGQTFIYPCHGYRRDIFPGDVRQQLAEILNNTPVQQFFPIKYPGMEPVCPYVVHPCRKVAPDMLFVRVRRRKIITGLESLLHRRQIKRDRAAKIEDGVNLVACPTNKAQSIINVFSGIQMKVFRGKQKIVRLIR